MWSSSNPALRQITTIDLNPTAPSNDQVRKGREQIQFVSNPNFQMFNSIVRPNRWSQTNITNPKNAYKIADILERDTEQNESQIWVT